MPRGQTNWARTRQSEASGASTQIADGLDVSFHKVANRTAGEGLLEAAEELGAEVLVMGSSSDGALGQVVARLDHRLAAARLAGTASRSARADTGDASPAG